MKSKSSTKHIICLIDGVEVQKNKIGLDDERIVRLLVKALECQGRTKFLDCPKTSWLTWILNTQPQLGLTRWSTEMKKVHNKQ